MQCAMLAHPAKLCRIRTELSTANGYGTKMSPRNHQIFLTEPQHHVINSANPRCALDDGVEDGLNIRGGATDDAEHLGCRSLMLQRLAQFCVPFLQLFE